MLDVNTDPFAILADTDASSRHYLRYVEANGSTPARPKGRAASTRAGVWDQIRRTEEEPMEMGTRDNTLLPDEYAVTKGLVSAVGTLTRTGA